jgi:uncharacterized protein (TIGR03790 family)
MRSILVLPLILLASRAAALEPADVWLVANKNVPQSRQVAEHYIAKRGVPKGNLIVLDLPKTEDITRPEYDAKLAGPLREALKAHRDKVKVLLTTYGVPLRVGHVPPNAEEKKEIDRLRAPIDAARKRLAELEKSKADKKAITTARDELERLRKQEYTLSHGESQASVDSELMLLWWPKYDLMRWVFNPLNFQATEAYRKRNPSVLMTCRLDGPTPDIAKRLVDDAVAVEATGLSGNVVIDARGIPFDPKGKNDTGYGYGGYDESFREAAKLLESAGMKVLLDQKNEVLPPHSAKGVAIYAGWYSHAKFVDCCDYVPGAIAWHLASSECNTLHRPDAKVWCPNLLKKGVCATLGPVAEPYTIGFPKPEEFFGFLATGEYTLVECYARTVPMCSWMTVLVGDPLYTPFKKNPKLKVDDVKPSPKGGKKLLP